MRTTGRPPLTIDGRGAAGHHLPAGRPERPGQEQRAAGRPPCVGRDGRHRARRNTGSYGARPDRVRCNCSTVTACRSRVRGGQRLRGRDGQGPGRYLGGGILGCPGDGPARQRHPHRGGRPEPLPHRPAGHPAPGRRVGRGCGRVRGSRRADRPRDHRDRRTAQLHRRPVRGPCGDRRAAGARCARHAPARRVGDGSARRRRAPRQRERPDHRAGPRLPGHGRRDSGVSRRLPHRIAAAAGRRRSTRPETTGWRWPLPSRRAAPPTPTTINGAGAVDVSYPGFFQELERLTTPGDGRQNLSGRVHGGRQEHGRAGTVGASGLAGRRRRRAHRSARAPADRRHLRQAGRAVLPRAWSARSSSCCCRCAMPSSRPAAGPSWTPRTAPR